MYVNALLSFTVLWLYISCKLKLKLNDQLSNSKYQSFGLRASNNTYIYNLIRDYCSCTGCLSSWAHYEGDVPKFPQQIILIRITVIFSNQKCCGEENFLNMVFPLLSVFGILQLSQEKKNQASLLLLLMLLTQLFFRKNLHVHTHAHCWKDCIFSVKTRTCSPRHHNHWMCIYPSCVVTGLQNGLMWLKYWLMSHYFIFRTWMQACQANRWQDLISAENNADIFVASRFYLVLDCH